MGLLNSLKNLFKRNKTNGKKVEVTTVPEVVISNTGKGGDDKATTLSVDDLDIQTTFNTDGIDILCEEGEIENVSD